MFSASSPLDISIHSPHARGDEGEFAVYPEIVIISIHSPHARGDPPRKSNSFSLLDFNPLPSCEGRLDLHSTARRLYHFNPLPSCEGRHPAHELFQFSRLISIHSPHARGDVSVPAELLTSQISIHSPHARGDNSNRLIGSPLCISIHSPHARGDPC